MSYRPAPPRPPQGCLKALLIAAVVIVLAVCIWHGVGPAIGFALVLLVILGALACLPRHKPHD